MIRFRKKEFSFTGALMVGSMVDGMVQGRKTAKQQERQGEEMMQQQARLAKKTNEALDRVAKAAQSDPSKAMQAAQVMQKSYAAPAFLAKAGQVVYEFGRALNKTGGGNQIAKKIGSGLAMGSTMAIGSYAIDKAIQADRKRITGGAPLPQAQEDPKKKKKAIRKAITGTALAAGSVLAARKGYLGEGFKKVFNTKAKDLLAKESVQQGKKAVIGEFKKGMTGKAALGGAGFAGLFALPYLSERKQLKDQAKAQEQRQYTENYQYQNEKKKGSVLGKVALGTAATIGSVALARRVGPAGLRKNINDMYMTYGKQIAGKNGNKLGNWMMKSGATEYGKAVKAQANKAIAAGEKAAKGGRFIDKIPFIGRDEEQLKAVVKAGETAKRANIDATKAGEARLKRIQSGKAGRKLGQGLLDGIGGLFGVRKTDRSRFLNEVLAKNPNTGKPEYSDETRKVAEFLRKHKRTAAVGGIAIGSLALKPFEWGDKAVRGATKIVDKNAFAYEKSKDQQV